MSTHLYIYIYIYIGVCICLRDFTKIRSFVCTFMCTYVCRGKVLHQMRVCTHLRTYARKCHHIIADHINDDNDIFLLRYVIRRAAMPKSNAPAVNLNLLRRCFLVTWRLQMDNNLPSLQRPGLLHTLAHGGVLRLHPLQVSARSVD